MGKDKDEDQRPKGSGSIYHDTGKHLWTMTAEAGYSPATGARKRITVSISDRKVVGDNKPTRKLQHLMEAKKEKWVADGKLITEQTPRLEAWLTRWTDEIMKAKLKPRTLQTYRSCINQCITPCIGKVRLDALGPRHFRIMEEWITTGDEETGRQARSSTTALRAYQILSKSLKDAIREGLIQTNPADKVDRPRNEAETVNILTPAQARLMIEKETDPMRQLMWRLAFTLGLRQGERLGLTPSELITMNGIPCVHVEHALQYIPKAQFPASITHTDLGGAAYLIPPKSKAGIRLVPIPTQLATALATRIKDLHLGKDDLIFTRAGQPISPPVDSRWWHAALDRAGLPDVHVHSARHTMATILAEGGVDEHMRMKLLGHTKATITAGYTHLDASSLLTATDVTQRALL